MKKLCLLVISVAMILSICACSSDATVSNQQTTESKVEEASQKSFKIGEEVFIKNDNGEYKITITGVEETGYRNQFSDSNPERVIIVSYQYENISLTDELYISDMNFKAYDKENNLMDTYPADVDYPDSVSTGRKTSGQMAFGLDSNENYAELEFYDNMFLDSNCKIILEW